MARFGILGDINILRNRNIRDIDLDKTHSNQRKLSFDKRYDNKLLE